MQKLEFNFRDSEPVLLKAITDPKEFKEGGEHLEAVNLTVGTSSLIAGQFKECRFINVRFDTANVRHAVFTRCVFAGCRFSERAGFMDSGCSLFSCNFIDCEFYGCTYLRDTLNKAPIVITGLPWKIVITEHCIAIGDRECYGIDYWASMVNEQIGGVWRIRPAIWEFWQQYKFMLLQIARDHRG